MTWKKYILYCLLLCLCFIYGINTNTNCSYAYTMEDMLDYATQISADTSANSRLKDSANIFIANYTILSSLENGDYNGFLVYKGASDTSINVYLFSSNVTIKTITSSSIYLNTNASARILHQSSGYYKSSGATVGTQYPTSIWGLVEWTTQPTNYYTYYFENKLNYFNLLGAENRKIDLLPWYFADARVGITNYNNNLAFRLLDTNNNFIMYLNAINETAVQGGKLYQLEIPYISWNNNNIINGNYYKVAYDNNSEYFYITEEFKISWEKDTSGYAPTYNSSGESTGAIDLTETNSKIDQVRQAIESGERKAEERQSFWEKAYNDMFVVSGDYIQGKLEDIKNSWNISGDYEIEEQIINTIQENGNDFIISWGSFTPHFSISGQQIENVQMISGDNINFSQMERDHEEFQEVMTWVRVLLGFSLGTLLLRNYWTTILMTLGIGIQVYDSTKEEKAVISTTTIVDKKGNTTTTKTIRKRKR